jgi:hypothetical protein
MAIGARLRGILDELIATGYPDQVAERIAKGDLDMRTDAIIERQQDMFPTAAFHGGGDDIRVIDPNRITSGKTANTGFFMSTSPVNAASYADRAGNVMPLAVDTQGFDVVNAGYNDWNRITNPDYLLGGERLATFGELPGYRGMMEPDRGIFDLNVVHDFDTDELARTARRFGSPGLIVQNVSDVGPNYKAFDPAFEAMTGLKVGDEGYQEALDNLFTDTIVASDPTRVRSLFAAFDPEYKGPNILGFQGGSQSPSLLNAAAQSTVGAASMIAPETSESELYEGLTDKMVDYLTEQMGGSEEDRERAEYISMGMDFLPFVGAAKGVSETFDAYKNDDTLGMALGAGGILAGMIPFGRGAYKSALGIAEDAPVVTRDTGLLQRVGDPESVNTMRLDVEPGVELAPSRLLRAEDLEGRGFVSGMADTSRGDLSRVVSVNGQPVDMVRFGGQDYMRQPQNVESGVLWASDAGAVTGLSNAARAAERLPGVSRSPLYIPYQMGGASTDFATMTSDIMVPIARQNMKKADKKALDKRIREGAGTKTGEFKPQPDWPGIDSPKADEWLANAGGNRKAVTKAVDEYRDVAGINLSQARAAIVDPEQLSPRVGNLRQAGILDLMQPAQPGIHPSYNTDLMGSYLGQFGEGANLLSDLNPLIRSSGKPFVPEMIARGHNLEAAALPAPVGKAMQAGLIGAFDQATLDDLIKKGLIAP